MNELLKSLKTADKDGIIKDPFISVEKHMERSGEERVVAKCGQRPPRVSAPEKGKQRKQTKLLESYVPAWFETYMYFVTYHNYVKPVPGMNFWPDQSMYSIVLPPKPRKIPGKPKKKRIRAIGEGGSSTRVSKVGLHRSCLNCKQPGYNKSSCKEPIVEQTLKPKGVVGRPRKKQLVDNFKDVDVVQRGPVRDEGACETRGGVIGSRGRGGR
ncbi:hypothetical protein Tco_1443007 [Tanacetum coccineum]